MNNEKNGIYDDNGNKINLNLLPLPGLCVTCIKHEYLNDLPVFEESGRVVNFNN
jgi:hypothetical protein